MPFVDLSQPATQNQSAIDPSTTDPMQLPSLNQNKSTEPIVTTGLPDVSELQDKPELENVQSVEGDNLPELSTLTSGGEVATDTVVTAAPDIKIPETAVNMMEESETSAASISKNHNDDYGLLEKAPEELKQGATEVREIKGPPLPELNGLQKSSDMNTEINQSNLLGDSTNADPVDVAQTENSLANDIAQMVNQEVVSPTPVVAEGNPAEPDLSNTDVQNVGATLEPSIEEKPGDAPQSFVTDQGMNLPPLDSILGGSTVTGVADQTKINTQSPTDSSQQTTEVVSEEKKDDMADNSKQITTQPQDTTKPKSFNPARILTNFNALTATMDDFMSYTIANNASDLHIAAEYPAYIRVDGHLTQIPGEIMSEERVHNLIFDILNDDFKKELTEQKELDLSYQHPSGDRFRINVFYKQATLSAALRLIPNKIRTISELGLPEILFDFIKIPNGLVLVTGPTGSGKSTTIAAMLQEINVNRAEHIITIEDPIEYVYPRMKSLVEQREVGKDTLSWTGALRSVLRQDPNIVLVGEMRDYETIEAAVTIAETGHLVFATVHTNSASQTIDRIIDVFPEGQQSQIRAQLANVVVGVVSQRLIPVKSGGRKAVHEIMIGTSAVKNAIREEKTYQIDNIIQTSSEVGMQTLESSLVKLIRAGEISMEEALNYTLKADELRSLLKTM